MSLKRHGGVVDAPRALCTPFLVRHSLGAPNT